jgi:hypothetical protein
MATKHQKKTVASELKRLEYARIQMNEIITASRLMGFETLGIKLSKAVMVMAAAEGEIEQSIFGSRGASGGYNKEVAS